MFEAYHKIIGECALTGRSANKKHTLPSSRSSIPGRKNESRKQTQTVRKRLLQDPRLQRSFCLQGVRTHGSAAGAGSDHRNHCPNCLSSLHVDIEPGDRAADCGGIMDPIAVWVRKNGEWAIVHRCRICGALSSNRIAADDNPMKLMSIAMKPLCSPPFPIERIRELTALMGGDGALE